VDVHVTGYRAAYEQRGKGWITIDGKTVATFCDFAHENAWRSESAANGKGPWNDAAFATIEQRHIFPDGTLSIAMGELLAKPIGECLRSSHTVVFALAVLDRRVGKRTLRKLEVQGRPGWAATLVSLRMEAEGLASDWKRISASSETANRSPAHPS
jgi:hypothetical protein